MTTIEQGTVSHGTHQPRHLIPLYIAELKRVSTPKYEAWVRENPEVLDGGLDYESEHAHYLVSELEDVFNSICPEGWYFGAHEGDGSDFGWWVDPNVEWECANG